MKKILVTGGAGYIGSHVCKVLSQTGCELVVLDNLSTGYKEAVKWGELIIGDLGDEKLLSSLFDQYKFHAVMHFAGSIVVPESVEDPMKYYSNNTVNSQKLIAKCVEHNVPNFIFSSTAAVYGELKSGLAEETLTPAPINPYGSSKLMTEMMLKDTAFAHAGFNYVALRYFNVSGADPDLEIGQAFPGATHLIKVACEAATGSRESISIFGTDFETQDGTGVRDYIHVVDLAKAHLAALNYLEEKKKSEIFNCGYGRGFSVKEVVAAVKEVSGVDFKVNETKRRAGDPATLISKVDKIKTYTNWEPSFGELKFIVKTALEWEKSSTLKEWKLSRREKS